MMKSTHFLTLCLFIVSSVIIFFPFQGAACSCVEPPGVKEELMSSEAVFSGKVLEVEEDTSAMGLTTKSVLFEVNETWKGVNQSQVKITTGMGGGDCGYDFKAGQAYLVYANHSDMFGSDGLTVVICSRTAEISAAQDDLFILGEGQAPGKKVDLQNRGAEKVFIILTGTAIAAFFIWQYFKNRHKKRLG
ncbi:hypothetical protein [Domibacillus robiginosus]|uniref:hypothetical protein n=1 Tax=Domibacillus robiginosus TaxID=1071054 RepID=UPI00067C3231|nr:hypothetical protein [Domibacillus robiginosus]